MASSIINIADFNPRNVRYSKVNPNDKGGKSIYVNYTNDGRNSGPFLLKFPVMFSWGASQSKNENNDGPTDKWKLSLQFPRDKGDMTPELEMFLQKMIELEKQFIADGIREKAKWFGSTKTDDFIAGSFGGENGAILKYTRNDRSRDPHIDLKLTQYEGVFKFNLYDEELRTLYSPMDPNTAKLDPLQFLPKFCHVQCIVQITLWFVGKSWYPSFILKQAICQAPVENIMSLQNCLFDTLSPDEKEKIGRPPINDEEGENEYEDETSAMRVEDSDEEDLPIAKQAAVPTPAPTKSSAPPAPAAVAPPKPVAAAAAVAVAAPTPEPDDEPEVVVPVKKTSTGKKVLKSKA